eukprot:TRINITY_DN8454_c0_g2_i1.p2 TRINITY_DN8454_c0_g2~~TRINITY_DN8454_c0_g2_i1.p2  ORF type:complete len:470 (-),score=83.39 TRINITY_DN8454_c0_g2_i1:1553-2962(-)
MTDSITLRFDTGGVDWTEAAAVFERAPLGTREPEKLQRAYLNSDLVCFMRDGDTLIGMGRALSDGEYQSVIYDVCLLPEYQGKGLGVTLMQALMDRLTTPSVVLWAVPGKEGFYTRFGFKPMLTAMARFEDPASSAGKGYIKLQFDFQLPALEQHAHQHKRQRRPVLLQLPGQNQGGLNHVVRVLYSLSPIMAQCFPDMEMVLEKRLWTFSEAVLVVAAEERAPCSRRIRPSRFRVLAHLLLLGQTNTLINEDNSTMHTSDNPTLRAIFERRSIRKYTDDPVSREDIVTILEAGQWAPSGLNNQPWRFMVITRDDPRHAGLAGCTKYAHIVRASSACICVLLKKSAMYSEMKDHQGAGACIQNMLLAAHALDLGAVWLGQIVNDQNATLGVLGIDPADFELQAVITLGHPAQKGSADRKPLSQLMLEDFQWTSRPFPWGRCRPIAMYCPGKPKPSSSIRAATRLRSSTT